MIDIEELRDCYMNSPSKMVLLVVDGLGGLAHPDTGKSELDTANIPNLDAMAQVSACGMTTPVLPGVAPGSGPGHLALFGYDPLKHMIGRGALEALGIDVELQPGDVAARGNFCKVDGDGLLVDRRAGRIPTELSAPICERLDRIEIEGVQVDVFPVQDYRFVLRLRGEGLSEAVTETDPQREGVAALSVRALNQGAERTADLVNQFVAQAARLMSEEETGEHAAATGVRADAESAAHGRGVPNEPGGHRRVPDVPGAGDRGRDAGDPHGATLFGRGGDAAAELRVARLLLHPLQASRRGG